MYEQALILWLTLAVMNSLVLTEPLRPLTQKTHSSTPSAQIFHNICMRKSWTTFHTFVFCAEHIVFYEDNTLYFLFCKSTWKSQTLSSVLCVVCFRETVLLLAWNLVLTTETRHLWLWSMRSGTWHWTLVLCGMFFCWPISCDVCSYVRSVGLINNFWQRIRFDLNTIDSHWCLVNMQTKAEDNHCSETWLLLWWLMLNVVECLRLCVWTARKWDEDVTILANLSLVFGK